MDKTARYLSLSAHLDFSAQLYVFKLKQFAVSFPNAPELITDTGGNKTTTDECNSDKPIPPETRKGHVIKKTNV